MVYKQKSAIKTDRFKKKRASMWKHNVLMEYNYKVGVRGRMGIR